MQLCFDAERFGLGLIETIALAKANGLSCVEFTVQPFSIKSTKNTSKEAFDKQTISAKEKKYLAEVKAASKEASVEIACLNLNYCLQVGKPKAVANFHSMISKIAHTAKSIGCRRLSFWLSASNEDNWLENCEKALSQAATICQEFDVKLILNCATYPDFIGKSLRLWQPLSPNNWRHLLSTCPELSLSLSPADCFWQGIDYLQVLPAFIAACEKINVFDVELNREMIADSGLFGPLFWRYRLPGAGQIDWRNLIEALKLYDFQGYLSFNLADEFVEEKIDDLNQALATSVEWLSPMLRQ
jgi:sugar phosphate isomerase/epimerase